MRYSRVFYFIAASTLIVGVIVMFAYDPIKGAIFTVIDLAILGLVYLFVFKTLMKNERLMEIGVPARARIVTARYTGTIVNDIYKQYDFTLEVFPEEGEPYEAKTRGLVPIEEASSFQPGAMIPVMVNPADPSQVAIGGNEDGELGNLATTTSKEEQEKQIAEMLERNEKQMDEILDKGTEAQAVILKAFELGINIIDTGPVMQFLLEIKPEEGNAFQAVTMGVIAEASVPKFQAGKTIVVKYDPDDISRVALFHS